MRNSLPHALMGYCEFEFSARHLLHISPSKATGIWILSILAGIFERNMALHPKPGGNVIEVVTDLLTDAD